VPGIGKKTAERLVVELRAKVGATSSADPISLGEDPSSADSRRPGDSRIRDAVLALTALGYKAADADEAVRRASLTLGTKATTEQLIKKALG
jgi:holliday junction DNA helicase RuvA